MEDSCDEKGVILMWAASGRQGRGEEFTEYQVLFPEAEFFKKCKIYLSF